MYTLFPVQVCPSLLSVLPVPKASKIVLRVNSLSVYFSMTDLTRSLIFDDNCQTSYLPTPPDSRSISPHYAPLVSHDSKGPFSGVATYPNGSCPEVSDKSERKAMSHSINPSEELLIVSPYSSRPHLLELKGLDEPSRLLAKALTVMRHVRDDYAIALYAHTFNWQEVKQQLRKIIKWQNTKQWRDNTFYVVVFRSRLAAGTDPSYLGHLVELSHAEATKTGRLLK